MKTGSSALYGSTGSEGIATAHLPAVFDAEQGTPELIDELEKSVPRIREIMAGLREQVPLAPHSGVGPLCGGRFFRIPNHYRSVSLILPAADSDDPDSSPGVVVFKGTEPLLPDFPAYFDWMLGAPFRASALPLALHFPLDMKLPPAAMWIEECVAEQIVSSRLQQLFLARHNRLARLPVPLYVYRMTPQQNQRYQSTIRSRLPADAMKKIRNKLEDGLGVEVYYYPQLPVRVADLFVGNVRETFRSVLGPENVEEIFGKWTTLLAEMLCLNHMPYAAWHHGMGGCVDQGNVCIDGGFNDLLTLIPFESIPGEQHFRQSLSNSIRMLAESMVAMATASAGLPPTPEPDAGATAAAYLTQGLRAHVHAARDAYPVDPRLLRYFEPPVVSDIFALLGNAHRDRSRTTQYLGRTEMPAAAPPVPGIPATADA